MLPWPLVLLHTLSGDPIIYHWYTAITVPGFLVAVSIGLEAIPAQFESVRLRNASGMLLLLAVAGCYAWFTAPQRNSLRHHSVEPLRESVAATRSVLNPDHPDIDKVITVGFCMATRGYDPAAYLFKTDNIDAFHALLDHARSENRPLHVNFALRGLARLQYPEMMKVIENPAAFDPSPPIHGLEVSGKRLVYRLRQPPAGR